MFSVNFLNNQTQILLSLSQVSSRHSGYFKHKTQNAKQAKAHQINSTATVICPESFQECLKNNKTLLQEFTVDIKTVQHAPKLTKHKPVGSARPVSFVSSESFLQNKNGPGWNANLLIKVGSNRVTVSGLPPSLCHVLGGRHLAAAILSPPTRGFKTDRSSVADATRNPSLVQRLRKFFGFQLKDEKTGTSNVDAARLEKLLQEDGALGSLSPEQKNKIKIAFAEGYLAGSHPDNQRGSKSTRYLKLAQQIFTITLFLALFISLVATVSGTVFRIQIGNQVEVDPEDINVTFDDVKGADEAKDELREVVEFLRSPEKFSSLGGKLPKGVLLVGPPGTGKTLLARAVAGEAGVPFFHAAGPEFDEILVGQGARRVRDLFKAAKERAPCVVFIDEIDSVGAKRTNSVLHPYANQTINQLLSEMDGFHQNEGVIVLGATNRKDDLDAALLRPGRFDVEVNVPTPDYTGRKDIIRLYLGRVAAGADVDVEMLARGTTGFTGADLENMVNQAALKAAIDGAKNVSMKYLEFARDKVLMGPERKSRLPDEEANTITAYHEGGHAIVAYYTKESSPLHKVTIMPRGPSLGHTSYIPSKERYHVTKQQLLAMMDTAMGGRAAEELIFGPDKITSGASSDLKQATGIASQMVKDFGMSERVGLRTYEHARGFVAPEQLGPNTSEMVDGEIKKILAESYDRAKMILRTHSKELKALAEALLKYETLDAEDVRAIMNGESVRSDRPRLSRERDSEREPPAPFLLPTPHAPPHPAPNARPNPA